MKWQHTDNENCEIMILCGTQWRLTCPGAPLTYFNDGGGGLGVRRIFLGLTFWPKGSFLGLWKTPGFFWVAKTTQGFFGVLYFSSAQINNTKRNLLLVWHYGIFLRLSSIWKVITGTLIQREIFNRSRNLGLSSQSSRPQWKHCIQSKHFMN